MSYRVFVRNGKIYKNHWGESGYEEKEVNSLLPLLNFPIQIENTTFGQFLSLLEKDVDIFQKIYDSALYGHCLKDYLEECKIVEGDPGDLEHVEVYWDGEIDEHESPQGEDNGQRPFGDYLTIHPGFHGWGPWNDKDHPDLKGGIAIEFSPVYKYQMLPLVLDKKIQIYKWADLKTPILSAYKDFTVHDVLSGILYEISFVGSPTARDQKMIELKETMNDMKETLDDEDEL